MIEVLQRFTWNGTPKEIGDLFRVTKNHRKARAVIFSPSIWLGGALAGRLTRGAGVVAGLPHAGRRAEHGRTVEGRDDREGLELNRRDARKKAPAAAYQRAEAIRTMRLGPRDPDFSAIIGAARLP